MSLFKNHKPLSILVALVVAVVAAVGFFFAKSAQTPAEAVSQASAVAEPTAVTTTSKYKILYIMSYHAEWAWTQEQFAGFKKPLDSDPHLEIEYKVFEMDTKRNSSDEWKAQAGAEAREIIETWQPDLVYLTDDDAQQYVTKYFIDTDTPFVFSGVNADPTTYGFEGSTNVTGVLERPHYAQSVQLLKRIDPSIKKIVVVLDDSPLWESVTETMNSEADQLHDIEIVSWDTIYTFEAYKQKIEAYQTTADAIALIGVFGFKDENGINVPYEEVLKWTAENSDLPDFSFWDDRVSFGTLSTVTVSGYEQGLTAGNIAHGILAEGQSPASYPMKHTVKGNPFVSLARANKLGLAIDSDILLSAQVIQDFKWEK